MMRFTSSRAGRCGALTANTAAATLLLSAGTGEAALAPEWQRAREFSQVVESATRALDGRAIDAVERIDATRWRVRAGGCVMQLRVTDKPRSTPGPQDIAATPEPPACR